jgi:hypothetical protein
MKLATWLAAGSTALGAIAFSPDSLANDCRLRGVTFSNLSNEQAAALSSSGGTCASGAPAGGAEAARFSEKGFILLGGKKIDYLELASENALRNSGKEIVIYGYLNYFSESEPNKVWGYRFDFELFEGDWLSGLKRMNRSSPTIDIVLSPSRAKSYPEPLVDTLDQMRRTSFRALTLAKDGKALVKITGKTGAYSNTGALYISAETAEIIR